MGVRAMLTDKRVKNLGALAALCAGVLAFGTAARSSSPPSRPDRRGIPGRRADRRDRARRRAGHDRLARQSVIVENRTGANAIIATDYVARAAPDGYTTLFSSLSLLVNAILSPDKIKYDPFKDFAPVSNAALLRC